MKSVTRKAQRLKSMLHSHLDRLSIFCLMRCEPGNTKWLPRTRAAGSEHLPCYSRDDTWPCDVMTEYGSGCGPSQPDCSAFHRNSNLPAVGGSTCLHATGGCVVIACGMSCDPALESLEHIGRHSTLTPADLSPIHQLQAFLSTNILSAPVSSTTV